ncbi:MAG: phosphoadenylyl-sulfate reductase [Marinilabiliales bacterium]|nr:phosphoadenylyl-sulfate reductase [Marinilabiliales bacterium]
MQEIIRRLNESVGSKGATELLKYFLTEYKGHIALASSLGLEDQVLTDMICQIDKTTPIFTLDTGRLFPETYDLIHRTNQKFGIRMKVYFPESSRVESMVHSKGINLFYQSIEDRKLCCQVRKLEPLQRAFADLKVWICGLRREQSVTRADMQPVEWDMANQLIKLNPLMDWSEKRVKDYVEAHKVPYNPLHDKGFPSIGCQPCTRAILPGEEIRAGRWWWESAETRECGLHKK